MALHLNISDHRVHCTDPFWHHYTIVSKNDFSMVSYLASELIVISMQILG